jgi:hypothetical protein
MMTASSLGIIAQRSMISNPALLARGYDPITPYAMTWTVRRSSSASRSLRQDLIRDRGLAMHLPTAIATATAFHRRARDDSEPSAIDPGHHPCAKARTLLGYIGDERIATSRQLFPNGRPRIARART